MEVFLVPGYLFLSTVILNKGTKRAQITDANAVKDFGIALVSTVILVLLYLATREFLIGYALAYLTILPMVKVVYKTPWDIAFKAWKVGFIILLVIIAVGFFFVLAILYISHFM